MRVTQCQRVVKYMQDFGSITHLEASADIAVQRLASRITDLKKRGYRIDVKMETGKNRYGEPTRYARYSLAEVQDESRV